MEGGWRVEGAAAGSGERTFGRSGSESAALAPTSIEAEWMGTRTREAAICARRDSQHRVSKVG